MCTKKVTIALSLGLSALACTSCATAAGSALAIEISPATTQVEGWLSGRGELMVFPRKDIRNYDPYAADDRAKCISVVNATGKSSAIISALDGRRVIAHGKVVDYDTLTDSSNPAERLLGRKYYGDEFVPNFCLRQFVFVASSLEAAD